MPRWMGLLPPKGTSHEEPRMMIQYPSRMNKINITSKH